MRQQIVELIFSVSDVIVDLKCAQEGVIFHYRHIGFDDVRGYRMPLKGFPVFGHDVRINLAFGNQWSTTRCS